MNEEMVNIVAEKIKQDQEHYEKQELENELKRTQVWDDDQVKEFEKEEKIMEKGKKKMLVFVILVGMILLNVLTTFIMLKIMGAN